MDSSEESYRSSWRDITVRSGKMEEYCEQTPSLCLQKVKNYHKYKKNMKHLQPGALTELNIH